jgi:hypothetical protein
LRAGAAGSVARSAASQLGDKLRGWPAKPLRSTDVSRSGPGFF